MKIKFLTLLFLTFSLTMNSQEDNPKTAMFYADKNISLIYNFKNEKEFLYLNKGNQKWFTNYEELREYLAKNDDIVLNNNFKDYFDYTLTNYNFFIGNNNDNINEVYEKYIKDFEKEYSISLSNKEEINKLFREKIKHSNKEELQKFLSKSEIPLLLYTGNYLIKNNKSDFRLHWLTVTETNIFYEEYLTQSLYFNDKKFNILKRIRYYFTEILNRHKHLKKNTEFDIDTMINFVESSILVNINSRYPISPLSDNYKKNMIDD